ncbi:MAG: DUF1501 domain-containing protein [Isosphaeraceae bacterium]|nr:DUF1501 domain-containing protein [Isosphaeraceae bacterium]
MASRQTPSVHERRHFLLRSACGLGMIALGDLAARDGFAATPGSMLPQPHFAPRAKRVIFIFMAGGPSHLDLFDPKPALRRLHGERVPESFLQSLADPVIKAGASVMASPRTFTRYGDCGMEFSDLLPHLGTCADDLCMVRSAFTTTSNHDPGQLLLQCGTTLFGHPCMGSWVTYGLGSECDNLPGFVVMLSNSGEGVDAGSALWSNGFLPSPYRGVTLRGQGDPILHLSNPPGVSRAAQRERLDALRDLNGLRAEETGDPEIAARVNAYELAFRMQMSAPELTDLSQESSATRALYGLDQDETRWFGTNCLLARRMVERGVRFVQLYHSTWDDHHDINKKLMKNCGMTDLPAAALIKDLKQRGLLDDTLVIWGGEFGRTPMNEVRRGNTAGKEGRDHHPFGFTMLLAGGGIRGGQIVGKTDELGYHAVEDRIHVHDLQATILHCLGLDHLRLTYRHQGRDFRLTDVSGNVVKKLLA